MLKVNRWLQDASPPNSYKIEIAYTDTAERFVEGKSSPDDTYLYRDLRWMDMVERFPNYAQANIYALKHYAPALYRVVGSNDPPNYFQFDHYKDVQLPVVTPELLAYLQLMKKSQRWKT